MSPSSLSSDNLSNMKSGWVSLGVSVIFILLLWQFVVWLTAVPSYILPSPWQVFLAFTDNFALIFHHLLVTANEVFLGLLFGSLLGASTALLLVFSSRMRQLVSPILLISQTIPVFALAPLLTLWFGFGLTSKIIMTILIVYFPVASTFYDGLMNTPQGYLNLAKAMGANDFRTTAYIRVPAALPALASGLRLASVYAPIGAVIGEWVGASAGLGYLMLLANGRVKTALMFAALFALCLFTIFLRAVIGAVCDRVSKWAGS